MVSIHVLKSLDDEWSLFTGNPRLGAAAKEMSYLCIPNLCFKCKYALDILLYQVRHRSLQFFLLHANYKSRIHYYSTKMVSIAIISTVSVYFIDSWMQK